MSYWNQRASRTCTNSFILDFEGEDQVKIKLFPIVLDVGENEEDQHHDI